MPEDKKPAETTIIEELAKPIEEPKGDGGGSADPVQQEEVKKPQSKEENAEFARRRRDEERQKALEQRELETAIKITGGENPYTHEKIEDRADLDEFYLMKEIEKNGGDPIADFAKHQKQRRKEEQDKNQKKTMSEDQARDDWQKFALAHPDISVETLSADEDFLDYADGKIGNKPLAQIYDDYAKRFLTKKETKKEEPPKTIKQTPGSLSSTVAPSSEIYSKSEYEALVNNPTAMKRLSDVDFNKVKKSADYWAKH